MNMSEAAGPFGAAFCCWLVGLLLPLLRVISCCCCCQQIQAAGQGEKEKGDADESTCIVVV
jgi:hypothetical protein